MLLHGAHLRKRSVAACDIAHHTDALVSRPHVRSHGAHLREGSVAACDIARHTDALVSRPHVPPHVARRNCSQLSSKMFQL